MVAHEVTRSVELDAPVDEVWSAVTEPGALSEWLDGDVEIEPRPAGRVSVVERDGTVRRGTVETVDPERELVFRWSSDEDGRSRVRFVLEPTDDGTRLTVVETEMSAAGRALASV
jgi:uncharacterized protein YndB with AHSA1/START domain